METTDTLPISDLDLRKSQGRELLNANRIREAVNTYVGILNEYSNDVETLLILGDLYLAGNEQFLALQLYARALRLDPTNLQVVQRIQLADPSKMAGSGRPGEAPTHPSAVSRLIQRLVGGQIRIPEQQIAKAASLLDDILASTTPARMVSDHLDDIDTLLPALIELNIRQAQADGYYDLADALVELQTSLNLKTSDQTAFEYSPEKVIANAQPQPVHPPFHGRVLLLVPGGGAPGPRLSLVQEILTEMGCQVAVASSCTEAQAANADVVITSNPHANPELLESLAVFSASHIPIIVDLDGNFEEMPPDHSQYASLGMGNPANARAYLSTLLLASQVTVPSEALAQMLRGNGYPVRVIPDGWSRRNELWKKPFNRRKTLNLGWVASTGQVEDVAEIRRIMIRVIREFPEMQLVIGGDARVYRLFENLPEGRKLFLPSPAYEDYPYVLGQIDMLVVPLRALPFNRALSDRPIMEAGVRGIPWVASPMPAFRDWAAGGLLANSLDEWHTYLRQLVMDADLRSSLGQAGSQRAEAREIGYLGRIWLDTIEEALANNTGLP